jgi:hypothetical protein
VSYVSRGVAVFLSCPAIPAIGVAELFFSPAILAIGVAELFCRPAIQALQHWSSNCSYCSVFSKFFNCPAIGAIGAFYLSFPSADFFF